MTSRQAMSPLARLSSVQPDTALLAALQQMESTRLAEVPVLRDEQLVGLLSREQVLHYLNTRLQLGV